MDEFEDGFLAGKRGRLRRRGGERLMTRGSTKVNKHCHRN